MYRRRSSLLTRYFRPTLWALSRTLHIQSRTVLTFPTKTVPAAIKGQATCAIERIVEVVGSTFYTVAEFGADSESVPVLTARWLYAEGKTRSQRHAESADETKLFTTTGYKWDERFENRQ